MADGILGLGSGQASSLNSDLIDKLKTAERKSTVEPIETRITKITTEKETFSSIETKVSELLEAIKPFDLFVSGGVNAFEQKSASTSGDSVTFDAADIKTLNTGTTSVNVSQLAQKDVYQSKIFNSTEKDAKVNLGILSINGLPEGGIDTTNLTYQQLANKISAEKGMIANIEQVGTNAYRLVIKSEESGIDNNLNISGYAGSALGFDTKDIYQSNTFDEETKSATVGKGTLTINGKSFNTDDLTYDQLVNEISSETGLEAKIQQVGTNSFRLLINSETSGATLSISGAASSALGLNQASNHLYKTDSHVLAAQNMIAKVDGVQYDVSTNSITVEGLKITANKIGTSSINISQDNTQLETQIKSFITKYNELVASVESEAQSATSSLADKSSIRSVVSQIKDKLFGLYGGDKKSLFNFGVELDKYGSLSLNSTKFNKAVNEDISSLKDLFLGTAENKGFGTVLKENLDSMTFTGGLLDTYEKAMLKRETTLNEEKTKAEKALDTKYEQLALQFSTYGTIINQMESSFSGLKMMIEQSMSS